MVFDSPKRREAPPLDPHQAAHQSSGARPLSPSKNNANANFGSSSSPSSDDPWKATTAVAAWGATSTSKDTRQQQSPARGGGTSSARQPSTRRATPEKPRGPPSPEGRSSQRGPSPGGRSSQRGPSPGGRSSQRGRMLEGGGASGTRNDRWATTTATSKKILPSAVKGDQWFLPTTPTDKGMVKSPTKWGSKVTETEDKWEDVVDEWRFAATSKSADSSEQSLYDDSGDKIVRVTGNATPQQKERQQQQHQQQQVQSELQRQQRRRTPTSSAKEGSVGHPISLQEMVLLDERDQGILQAAKTKIADARDHDVLQRAAAKRHQPGMSENFSFSSSVDSSSTKSKKKKGIMGFFRGVSVMTSLSILACPCFPISNNPSFCRATGSFIEERKEEGHTAESCKGNCSQQSSSICCRRCRLACQEAAAASDSIVLVESCLTSTRNWSEFPRRQCSQFLY